MNSSQRKFSDDQMPIVKGFVGPHLVAALRDTGCSSVVVKRQFVCCLSVAVAKCWFLGFVV